MNQEYIDELLDHQNIEIMYNLLKPSRTISRGLLKSVEEFGEDHGFQLINCKLQLSLDEDRVKWFREKYNLEYMEK